MTTPELLNLSTDLNCTVNVYTNRQQLFCTFMSDEYLDSVYVECLHDHNTYRMAALRLSNRYVVCLDQWYKLLRTKQPLSFIEVFNGPNFIARHFIRNGKIMPIVSIEQDRTKCKLIRSKIMATQPTMNWAKALKHDFTGGLSKDERMGRLMNRLSAEVEFYPERGSVVKNKYYRFKV